MLIHSAIVHCLISTLAEAGVTLTIRKRADQNSEDIRLRACVHSSMHMNTIVIGAEDIIFEFGSYEMIVSFVLLFLVRGKII